MGYLEYYSKLNIQRRIIVIRLLILELLSQQSMSGYQMKQILEQTDAKRWSGVLPGSIYNALNKLEKDGFIEIESIKMTGNRQKAIYKISEKGKQHQKKLILSCLEDGHVSYNGEFYSGIGFAYQVEKSLALNALKLNKKQLQFERDTILKGKLSKEQAMLEPVSELSEAVFTHMIKTIELQLELVEKVTTIISSQNNSE